MRNFRQYLLAGAVACFGLFNTPASAKPLPDGPFSVKGALILAPDGSPVRLSGFHYWPADNQAQIEADFRKMLSEGANVVRVSWLNKYIRSSNRDLLLLDRTIAAADATGMKVILDNHANNGENEPCWAQQANGLWYDTNEGQYNAAKDNNDGCGRNGGTTHAQWVKDWATLAQRYAGRRSVIGADLHNEPINYGFGADWTTNNVARNLRLAYQQAGNEILKYADWLIIAEGSQDYSGGPAGKAPWGDLSQVQANPLQLSKPRVVYSVHDYPVETSGFNPDGGDAKYQQAMKIYGYLTENNIAPVLIGEWGANMKAANDPSYVQTLVDRYMNKYPLRVHSTFYLWNNSSNCNNTQPCGAVDGNGNVRQDVKANNWAKVIWKGTETDPALGNNPPPPPPPVFTESKDRTSITSANDPPIINSVGDKWTLTADGKVAVNGVADDSTGRVVRGFYLGHEFYQQNADNNWWKKKLAADPWAQVSDPTGGQIPPTTTVTKGQWQQLTLGGMTYFILPPAQIEAGKTYPLVLFLHQFENASGIPAQLEPWFNTVAWRSKYPAYIVAPQCWNNNNDVNWGGVNGQITNCEKQAVAIAKAVAAANQVDKNRLYVTGDSMGGIGSWEAAIQFNAQTGRQEKIFAAFLPLAGAVYSYGFPQPNADVLTALANVPIYAIHGANDTSVPLDWDRNVKASNKLSKFTYEEVPGYGHDVWDDFYPLPKGQKYWDWLFQQAANNVVVTPPPPVVNESAEGTLVDEVSDSAIIDATGAKWTLVNTAANGLRIAVNGAPDTATERVVKLLYSAREHRIYQMNLDNNWWWKSKPADNWTASAAPNIVGTAITHQTVLEELNSLTALLAASPVNLTEVNKLLGQIKTDVGVLKP